MKEFEKYYPGPYKIDDSDKKRKNEIDDFAENA